VKILVIVNSSPWGSSLGTTALRLVKALAPNGLQVAAVYFRGDGVYQSQAGRAGDTGTPELSGSWLELARQHRFPLLVCRSAAQRRLPEAAGDGFREAGLAEVLELADTCDRVLSL